MKKEKLTRYDLDRVYYLNEYKKTVAHAEQNIGIAGIKEQLDSLKTEKSCYSKEVSALVEAGRDDERQKYEKYEKWATVALISKRVLLGGLVIHVLGWFVPNPIYRALSFLFGTLASLAILLGCLATIVSFLRKSWYRQQYQKYIDRISGKIDSLGRTFTQISKDYYLTIDGLYLNSLDPIQRELVLVRREQAAQSQKLIQAQGETQRLQKKLIEEQQKTRRAQEELLSIERKREAEKEAARRRW